MADTFGKWKRDGEKKGLGWKNRGRLGFAGFPLKSGLFLRIFLIKGF